MIEQNLEFILVKNFKCRRCGCTHYDKIFYTGMKELSDENSIQEERYVCRNCDFPVNIQDYIPDETISMSSKELLDIAKFVDEGVKNK